MDGPSLPARIARVAFAIIGSGIVAGIAFLILIQEAERRGHTDLDFNHTLGNIVEGAQTEDATTSSALGVIGDSAAPTGPRRHARPVGRPDGRARAGDRPAGAPGVVRPGAACSPSSPSWRWG